MTAPVRVGQAGLGNWGQNLVRNFDELAENAALVIDLRNATGRAGIQSEKIWKL